MNTARRFGFAVLIGTICAVAQATDTQTAPRADLWPAPQVEATATKALQKTVDAQPRLGGQEPQVSVQARVDATGRRLYVDLGAGYAPGQYTPEFEDRLHELTTTAFDAVQERSRVREVRFLIGGKDLFEHFPEQTRARSKSQRDGVASPVRTAAGRGS